MSLSPTTPAKHCPTCGERALYSDAYGLASICARCCVLVLDQGAPYAVPADMVRSWLVGERPVLGGAC